MYMYYVQLVFGICILNLAVTQSHRDGSKTKL